MDLLLIAVPVIMVVSMVWAAVSTYRTDSRPLMLILNAIGNTAVVAIVGTFYHWGEQAPKLVWWLLVVITAVYLGLVAWRLAGGRPTPKHASNPASTCA